MFKRNLIFTLTACLMSGLALDASAQNEPSNKKSPSDKTENASFPDKKPDQWAIGLHFGNLAISGDVRERIPGLGYGLDVRKSFGHVMSGRAMVTYGNAYGLDLRPMDKTMNSLNAAVNGSNQSNGTKGPDYVTPNRDFVNNYKNTMLDFSLQAVASINNLNFYRKKNRWDLYVFAGIGGMTYKTKVDALDANGKLYDFSKVDFDRAATTKRSNAEIRKELLGIFDGTYETEGPSFGKDRRLVKMNLAWKMGAGIQRRLGKNFAIGIEQNYSRVSDDLLDTRQYSAVSVPGKGRDIVNTKDHDNVYFTNVVLEYRIGKGVTSRWWENPLEPTYKELAEASKKIKDASTDSDGDGIADIFDQEPNTPAGAMVNSRGVTMDSDGDGVPDHLDDEPYSQDPSRVNDRGVSINRLITDPNSPVDPNNMLDPRNPASPFYGAGGKGADCNPVALPMVHFDLDKYYIKPEFFAAIHEVATLMLACKDMKIVAIGHTDVRESANYNAKLSYNRVNKVLDYMVQKYGISRDRFIVQFSGESSPLIPGLPDNSWDPKYEPRQYMNRRVEFKPATKGQTGSSNPAAPNAIRAGEDY